MSRPQAVVEADRLVRIFTDFWHRAKAKAVDGVDFRIEQHEIFGLLGPNGSGKSTIIKMILGLLHVTSGRLRVFGRHPSDVAIKRRIGYLPEESHMYRFLNPEETLDYYARLFGYTRSVRRRRIGELLDMVGLTAAAHRPVGEFSKGMTRRLGLAQALINDPDLLILDEPTSGLDPIGTRQVKDLLLELGRRGKTILLSSHLLADVEDVCDRMVVLYGGRVRAEGTADQLLRDSDHTVIRTTRLTPEMISRVEGVLASEGMAIDRVEAPRQRLEELFMEIVERARREQVATAGAQQGGRTAKFLRGEDEQGEALIDSLVREESPAPTASAPARAKSMPLPEEELLKELVDRKQEQPAARAPSPPPQAPEEVDDSVIQDLLGGGSPAGERSDDDADSQSGGKPGSNSGGRKDERDVDDGSGSRGRRP